MKTTTVISSLIVILGFILLQSATLDQNQPKTDAFYPSDVRKVVENKCYSCHSVKGKSQDARDALMWDSLPSLSKSGMVGTLDEIIEVLQDNIMPPESAVKKYPEMKLQDAEKKTLLTWAEKKAESLMK
jgi:hypothetical protein